MACQVLVHVRNPEMLFVILVKLVKPGVRQCDIKTLSTTLGEINLCFAISALLSVIPTMRESKLLVRSW